MITDTSKPPKHLVSPFSKNGPNSPIARTGRDADIDATRALRPGYTRDSDSGASAAICEIVASGSH
jgi:hypothetical protein